MKPIGKTVKELLGYIYIDLVAMGVVLFGLALALQFARKWEPWWPVIAAFVFIQFPVATRCINERRRADRIKLGIAHEAVVVGLVAVCVVVRAFFRH